MADQPSDASPEAGPPPAPLTIPTSPGLDSPPSSETPRGAEGETPASEPRPKRRLWVWFAILAVVIIAAAASLFGWVLTRPDPIAFPTGACVDAPVQPVVYGCDDSKSTYRIVGREDVAQPLDSACVKYPDATRVVGEPTGTAGKIDTVLCLAPTRFNLTDPGQLQAGDCVAVKGGGDQIMRVDCGLTPSPVKVVAVEQHSKIPVTDQACKQHPQARAAFAQSSLGGRVIVVCGNDVDPNSMDSVKLGDCASRDTMKKVDCADPTASARVLSVRTAYEKPKAPECPDDLGFYSVMTRANDKTDLVLIVCMGPVDLGDSRYAVVGDCISGNGRNSGSAADTHRIDCGDPKALYQVFDRHELPDDICPAGVAVSLTYTTGGGSGSTVCLRRK
ncbi:hypothetical protein D7D52_16675 [Nocardia yunnanensis]|uniref:Uncharacterized protein n=1 Tax=Nocardia yunnanensis TaxID=2382165 RepID=A0A386ZCA0_9NOCA|nr:hypothetical protein [Nocardia yunnanensis]AYF75230.1 hypothetical protein D7D52_16675 [Nocardia yunnanensis]